jgi:hypothetical protein
VAATTNRLIAAVRGCCLSIPDKRQGRNAIYAMADFGMAAFSAFFMQSPSFLAHQRHLAAGQGRSNCQTLFAMDRIPCDNQIRAMLDPVEPEQFHPAFAAALAELQRSGAIDQLRVLGGHLLIALDGSEYYCSTELHCPNCSTRKRSNGAVEYHHALLAATLVCPGHNRAVPLEPEFIVPQDGQDKQDCESRAMRRWLTAHGARYARLKPVYLGDDLYSRQPTCQAVLDAGAHFIFVCKPASHQTIEEYRTGVALEELTTRVKLRGKWGRHRYRWLSGVPLRDGDDALKVNWFMIEILDPAGKVTYRNSFITDFPVGRDAVAELAACGRARWKVENEAFNTLKTKGYHLEHNFGHGQQNLSTVLATLNLLAFACHTVCELAGQAWQAAMRATATRQGFFQHLRAITTYLLFPSWDHLLATLAFTRPPPLGP